MAQSAETRALKGPGLAAALAAAVAVFTPGAQPVAAFLTTFAVSYGLQAWSMREARKRSLEDRADAKNMIRSAVSPHRIVYGEAVVSGTLVFAEVHGAEKEVLHMVVAMAGHEIHSTGDIYIDDQRIAKELLDENGDVGGGTYSGLARFQFVRGTATQSAFVDLVAATSSKWTSAHQGKGIAAMYARLTWNQDKFQGIPQLRALVRGAQCYDPRDAATRHTMNPALILRDYLTASYGLGVSSARIDDTAVGVAADVCDEWVALDASVGISVTPDHTNDTFAVSQAELRIQTGDRVVLNASVAPTGLTAGGTYYVIRRAASVFQVATTYQNALEGTAATFSANGTSVTFNSVAQRRYAISGTFTADQAPKDVIDEILASMAGALVHTGGAWRMSAGAYVAPAATLSADDLRGPVTFRHRQARAELVNAIRGTYAEPGRDWVLADYPAVSDSAYATEDGATIARQMDFAWVANSWRAQRLARIALEKARAKRLVMPCKIGALRLLTTDTVQVTLSQLGLASAVYRVVGWTLTGSDGGIGVDLELEEEAAAHYAWDAADGVAPRNNTALVLPSGITVATPGGVSVFSGNAELLAAGDGTIISRMRVAWTAAAETNATGYEIQWKRSSESTYNSASVPRDATTYYIGPVEDGATYDVRVRTLATPGTRRSDWVTNSHAVAGKSAAPTAPNSLGVTSLPSAFALSWSASPDADYAETEVWESSTNNRSAATRVATLKGNALTRSGFSVGDVRYWWILHKDTSGNVSAWYPSSATGGVTATAGDITLGPDAVDTINIVANAVTDITSAYTEATTVISAGAWTQVQSISVTTDGSPVALFGTCHANVGGGGTRSCSIRMLRDATVLATGTMTGYNNADGFLTLGANDAPAAGTYIYSIECNPSGGAGIDVRYLQGLETKR